MTSYGRVYGEWENPNTTCWAFPNYRSAFGDSEASTLDPICTRSAASVNKRCMLWGSVRMYGPDRIPERAPSAIAVGNSSARSARAQEFRTNKRWPRGMAGGRWPAPYRLRPGGQERSGQAGSVTAVASRVAIRGAPGVVCSRIGLAVEPEPDRGSHSRQGAAGSASVSPGDDGGVAGLRFPHRCVLLARRGACLSREGGVSGAHGQHTTLFHDHQRIPAGTAGTIRIAVCRGARAGSSSGRNHGAIDGTMVKANAC